MVKSDLNKILDEGKSIIKNKKFQIGLTIILFLAILISSTSLRMSNLPNLVDSTTGLYTSNDLDSLYFYRMAETQLELGYLPEVDVMRAPGYNSSWVPEIIDNVLIWNYKILNFFNSDISFNYASTISAPIIFAILLIAFFFLCLLLTKSKTASLIASAFLAYSPAFLFRSVAGFYDHDHLGVLAVILLVIASVFALKRFEKTWKESVLWGVVIGFFTSLVFVSWGGAITFVFLFLPMALFFHYLTVDDDKKMKFIIFYALWILTMIIFTPIIGGSMRNMIGRVMDSQGLAVLFVFGFSIVDLLFIKFKKNLKFINEKYEKLYSLGITAVLGLVGLMAIGKHPIKMLQSVWASLIYPFFGEFGGRLSSTVAENAQPYLVDLMNQTGKMVFWLFLFGLVFVGIGFAKNVKSLKNRIYLSVSAVVVLIAILCSRISGSHILNGENMLSQAIYLVGALGFFACLLYVYNKEKFSISGESVLLFSIALASVINARAAVRSFFLITPFTCLIAGYFIAQIVEKLEVRNE